MEPGEGDHMYARDFRRPNFGQAIKSWKYLSTPMTLNEIPLLTLALLIECQLQLPHRGSHRELPTVAAPSLLILPSPVPDFSLLCKTTGEVESPQGSACYFNLIVS